MFWYPIAFYCFFRSAFLCTLIYKFIKRVQHINTSKWNLLELLSCYCNFRQLIIILFVLEYMTTLSLDIQLQITPNNTPAITKVAYSWNLISLIFSSYRYQGNCLQYKKTISHHSTVQQNIPLQILIIQKLHRNMTHCERTLGSVDIWLLCSSIHSCASRGKIL